MTASGFTGAVARPSGVTWIAAIPASRAPSTSRIESSPTCTACLGRYAQILQRAQEDRLSGLPDPAFVGEGQHAEQREESRLVEHLSHDLARRTHGVRDDREAGSLGGERLERDASARVDGRWGHQGRARVGADQGRHGLGAQPARQRGIDGLEERHDVFPDRDVPVHLPELTEPAGGGGIASIELGRRYRDADTGQRGLNPGQPLALVAIIARGPVEKQRAPQVERHRTDHAPAWPPGQARLSALCRPHRLRSSAGTPDSNSSSRRAADPPGSGRRPGSCP